MEDFGDLHYFMGYKFRELLTVFFFPNINTFRIYSLHSAYKLVLAPPPRATLSLAYGKLLLDATEYGSMVAACGI